MKRILFILLSLLGGCSVAVAQTTVNAGTSVSQIAPSQTSNSGKFLTTDGTNTSWAAAGGTPQFSFSSAFEASARVLDNSSGGATGATFGSYGMKVTTGTGTSGKVWTDYYAGSYSGANNYYSSAGLRLTFYLTRVTQGSDYDFLCGLFNGNSSIISAASIDYTKKHVGVKCNRTASGSETWSGTCGDGSAESTVSLTVSTPTDINLFTVTYTSTSVAFYVNGTLAGTITTHIPALADIESSGSVCSVFLTNRAVASSTVFGIGAFEFAINAY